MKLHCMKHNDQGKRPIGGFFELETPAGQELYHNHAAALSNGRACMMVALEQIQPKRAFVPHYTCDAAIEPFRRLQIDIEFYELNGQFEPQRMPEADKHDCYLLTNYWGMQRGLVERFEKRFGNRLMVDNTHDYFFRPTAPGYWSFTSARKWFGVPDGAFLYSPVGGLARTLVQSRPANREIELQPALERSLGRLGPGYRGFQEYEKAMGCDVKQISSYSSSILSLLDHASSIERRRRNFDYLAKHLNDRNRLSPTRGKHETPFCYPYLPHGSSERQKLHDRQIFVPQLWREAIERAPLRSNAKIWSEQLLPLPVDHRYGIAEMKFIAATILQREAVA